MDAHRPRPRAPVAGAVWLSLLVVLIVSAGLRLNLLDVPLERDEGEYAYAAQRFLDGGWLYRDIHTMKLPGTHLAYVPVIGLFGESARGIHLGLLLLTTLNQVLVFLIGRHLSGAAAGLFASLAYGLLAFGPSVLGHSANTEHFVLAAALAGTSLVLQALDSPGRWRLFAAGCCFGVAVLMKQHGGAFAVAALIALVLEDRARGRSVSSSARSGLLVLCGAAVPLVLLLLVLAASGTFGDFVFWTIEYGLRYVSGTGLSLGLFFLRHNGGAILLANPLVWTLTLVGIVVVIRRGWKSTEFAVLMPWGVMAALATSAGFYFRPHYFLLLLPAAAVFAGTGATALAGRVPRRLGTAALFAMAAILVGGSVVAHREVLIGMEPDAISRRIYGQNPFAASASIADSLARRTGLDDEIAILGSEPQILFHARRRSASPFIYVYPLMEDQPFARRMQDEMIARIERSAPKLLVFVNVPTSWLATAASDQHVLEWAQRYWNLHYRRIGVIELGPDSPARQRWGDQVAAPRGRTWIAVFERKPGG